MKGLLIAGTHSGVGKTPVATGLMAAPLSALKERSDVPAAYRVIDQDGRHEGFRIKSVLASYVHLHLGSKRNLARNIVNFCASWRETSST
jgi:cobyrinic acid a,c-diamide synthase